VPLTAECRCHSRRIQLSKSTRALARSAGMVATATVRHRGWEKPRLTLIGISDVVNGTAVIELSHESRREKSGAIFAFSVVSARPRRPPLVISKMERYSGGDVSTKPEFQPVGHSGGSVIIRVGRDSEGRRGHQLTWQNSRPVPAGMFGVYALPQGIVLCPAELGGMGSPMRSPNVPGGCFLVFIGSDSEGLFGRQCPGCRGYWRGPGLATFCLIAVFAECSQNFSHLGRFHTSRNSVRGFGTHYKIPQTANMLSIWTPSQMQLRKELKNRRSTTLKKASKISLPARHVGQ
jgi:hypothetical protein